MLTLSCALNDLTTLFSSLGFVRSRVSCSFLILFCFSLVCRNARNTNGSFLFVNTKEGRGKERSVSGWHEECVSLSLFIFLFLLSSSSGFQDLFFFLVLVVDVHYLAHFSRCSPVMLFSESLFARTDADSITDKRGGAGCL